MMCGDDPIVKYGELKMCQLLSFKGESGDGRSPFEDLHDIEALLLKVSQPVINMICK